MRFRFRYLDPNGSEVQVENIEGLRERLDSGDVTPDTLLHDALTGEWAPLRAHAVGRLLHDLGAGAPDAPVKEPSPPDDRPKEEKGAAPPAAGSLDLPGLDDLSLTLSPEHVSPSAEDTVRELLKERERERDGGGGPAGVATPEPWHGGVVVEHVVEPSASDAPAAFPASPTGASAPRDAARRESRSPARVPVMPPPRRHRRGGGRLMVAAGSAGLLALLVYAVAWSDDGPATPAEVAVKAPSVLSASSPASEPVRAASLLGSSEKVALGDMVEALDSVRRARDLQNVPTNWLDGIYLANASHYPEVRAYWERYQRFVDDVQQTDTALFRQSFVRRLEAEGVRGPMVSMRLARAIQAFDASQPRRDTIYAAMEELAGTSLELHDLLVEREADIHYAPVLPDRVSRDPVVEAVVDDPALHDHMWTLLDRIFKDLSVLNGGAPGTRDALTTRALEGIRPAGGS